MEDVERTLEVFTIDTQHGPIVIHDDNAWNYIRMYYTDTWESLVNWADYQPPPLRVGETIEISYEEFPIRKDDICLQYVICIEEEGYSRHVYARWLGHDKIFTPDYYDKVLHPCRDLWEKCYQKVFT